ncbi:MAG: sulfite oxidase-like oxidoreductase [Thermodesulfovibrionales bacterium]|nr:sulfite oxidase-like oxidoreductase [Thermodesulfovibrionales bacterium]
MSFKRLPPGQKLTDDFPVLHYSHVPKIDIEKWQFEIKGKVKNKIKLSFIDFIKLPTIELKSDFHCVTGWSKFDLLWKGVLFKDIVSLVQPFAEARYILISSKDGYTTNMPLKIAMDDDVILAFQYNGKPLTLEHGYPLRLVVPKRYAYKSAKWVKEIEFLQDEQLGYWEQRGYSNSADPWNEERYSWR